MTIELLDSDFEEALSQRGFVLHYQPVITLATGEPVGVEALIRWNHPARGHLQPAEFIPQAERIGAIVPIGAWVLLESVRACKRLEESGFPIGVAFNVTADQLQHPRFLDLVDAAVAENDVDPARLIIEITESVAIGDPVAAKRILRECQARGLKVALDDFGTGYSSLRHLIDFTVDFIKIDRSFVTAIPEHTQSVMVAKALVELSHSLGAAVQAEGVETAAQLVWLQQRGCDLAQGYHIGEPLEFRALLAWLEERASIVDANVVRISERQIRSIDMIAYDVQHPAARKATSGFTVSRELLRDVLDVVPAGIALADRYGNVVEQNERFAQFSAPVSAILSSYSDDFVSVEVELRSKVGQVVRALIRRSVDGSNIILTRADIANQPKDKALSIMLRALHEDRDLYRSAVYALARSLGWRWIGIGRFMGNGSVDVLAWWDGGQFSETFSYDLAGTPCERVAEKGQFQAFEQVAQLFPDDAALARVGAQYYAGQVYLGRDGVPLGHVFMLDDHRREDMAATEEVLDLVCELVGAQLRLQMTEEVAEQAMLVARTDSLTGVRNRTAFDEDMELLGERYATGSVRDALMVAIDLDGTKRVNDSRGHSAGDEMLRRFCEGLRVTNRNTDRIYRVGGDEFVLVLANGDEAERQMIRERVRTVITGVCEGGFPEIDASLGFATIREAEGSMEVALRLADERMYAEKRGKKRALRR